MIQIQYSWHVVRVQGEEKCAPDLRGVPKFRDYWEPDSDAQRCNLTLADIWKTVNIWR